MGRRYAAARHGVTHTPGASRAAAQGNIFFQPFSPTRWRGFTRPALAAWMPAKELRSGRGQLKTLNTTPMITAAANAISQIHTMLVSRVTSRTSSLSGMIEPSLHRATMEHIVLLFYAHAWA